jgi:hypothetical protein
LRGCILPSAGTRRECQSKLRAVVHLGQAQHLRDVKLDGVFGNPQFAADLVVGLPLGHQTGNILLAPRERSEQGGKVHLRVACCLVLVCLSWLTDPVQLLVQIVDGRGQKSQLLVEFTQFAQASLPFQQCGFLTLNAFEQLVEVHGFLKVVGDTRPQRLDDVLLDCAAA